MVISITFLLLHYTCYSWFYHLKLKSNGFSIFSFFLLHVERFSNTKLITLQMNGGGEFKPLTPFCQQHGISHCFSCPHTHQQNGLVEQKHLHIVETGLALLAHAFLPPTYWADAFETAVYLINLLPTKTLKNNSPYSLVFNQAPDYKFLKILGCTRWPNLRPYNKHKLPFRSTPCLFLGYSTTYKGYKCLDLQTHRLYSRDVVFHALKIKSPTRLLTQPSPNHCLLRSLFPFFPPLYLAQAQPPFDPLLQVPFPCPILPLLLIPHHSIPLSLSNLLSLPILSAFFF